MLKVMNFETLINLKTRLINIMVFGLAISRRVGIHTKLRDSNEAISRRVGIVTRFHVFSRYKLTRNLK